MRTILSILMGLALIAGAIFISKNIIANKKKPKPRIEKVIKNVRVNVAKNKDVPIVIKANGSLKAKHKIDLFSEVQGVLKSTGKEFKDGTKYKKGEAILKIDSEEFFTNLQTQKSRFYSSIISILPDIKLDFPEEYEKWHAYLNNFDINKSIPALPVFTTEKEKYFISGKGLSTEYYSIKNLEVKLKKYTLHAPFYGVLTETVVTTGTLIRVGQKLAEYINPSTYEVEVSTNAEYTELLKIGKKVKLYNLEETKEYDGKVIRINGKVEATTQTIKVYIQVSHKDLREGLYLVAHLNVKSIEHAVEVSRKLLLDNDQLFVVKDSTLGLINIDPVYFTAETVVVKGIDDGVLLLSKTIPGAYDGMRVKVMGDNKQ